MSNLSKAGDVVQRELEEFIRVARVRQARGGVFDANMFRLDTEAFILKIERMIGEEDEPTIEPCFAIHYISTCGGRQDGGHLHCERSKGHHGVHSCELDKHLPFSNGTSWEWENCSEGRK